MGDWLLTRARNPLKPRIKDYKVFNITGLNEILEELEHDITIYETNLPEKKFNLHIGVVDVLSDHEGLDIPDIWFSTSGKEPQNTSLNIETVLEKVKNVRLKVGGDFFDYYTDKTEIDKVYGHYIVTEGGCQWGPNEKIDYEQFQFIQVCAYLTYIEEILTAEL